MNCADPDPWKFDPSREMDTKAAFGFVGWGAGDVSVCMMLIATQE